MKELFFMRNNHLQVEAYTDSDYGGSIIDMSTSGYYTFVGGNLVTWRSKKQIVVARSSAEAEFRAMAQGVCELLWIKIILTELKLAPSGSMKLYCDNKAAINIAYNPVQHDRTKYVNIDMHFIKENVRERLIYTPFVKTGDQIVNILTKGITSRLFYHISAN